MNATLVLALLAAAISVRAFRLRGVAGDLARPLGLAGLSFVLAELGARFATFLGPSAAAPAARAVAVVAALLLWDALVTLALHDLRGRSWIVNAAFAALAVMAFQSTGSLFLPVVLATMALTRWRARRDPTMRERWAVPAVRLAVPGAALLVTVEIVLWLTARPGTTTADAALRFVEWTCAVAAIQAAQELPGMVRQAALSVRHVRRRLTLLFTLAAFVPLALTATLWALTTWLGVGAEDALIAARALRENAVLLDQSLAAAHRRDPALVDFARHWDAAWNGGELWLRSAAFEGQPPGTRASAARWRHLTGSDSVDVRALEAWHPSDSLRLAVLDGRTRLIATHVSALDSSLAVALVPVAPLLSGRIARVVGVRLKLETDFPSLPDARARADAIPESIVSGSSQAPEAIGPPPASEPRWVITPRSGRGEGVEAATPRSGLFNGRAAVAAMVWTHGHWAQRFALLAAEHDAHRIFLGLYRDVRENPFAIIPLATLVFVFAVFVFVLIFDFRMVRELGQSVTGAVATLRDGTAALERGDLSHRIEVRGHDDLWEVAEAFNRMAAGLERGRELEAERRRVEEELSLARRIQARLLPGEPPRVPGLEIAGVSESAREVGGDYYDHFLMADGRVALAVADVSGKGVPAALLMSAVRAALISQPVEAESPAEVLGRIHRLVHRSVEPGRFVTAFLAFLDPRTGQLEYCNAGHNPPIVVHRGGSLERLELGGLVLGVVENAGYQTGELVIPPGSLLALFSDGIPEAQNPAGALWEEEPLIVLLRDAAGLTLAALARRVVDGVRAFEAGRAPSDDVTLLLARRS